MAPLIRKAQYMFVIILDIAFVLIPHPDPHGQVTVSSRPREVPILSCWDTWNLWRPTVDQAIRSLEVLSIRHLLECSSRLSTRSLISESF